MNLTTRIALLAFFLIIIISGCSPGENQSPVVDQPIETEAPQKPSSWVLLLKEEIEQPLRIAAFLNPNFGITGGPSDLGKAHVTTDGGQSWHKAESSTDCLFAIDVVDSQVAWQCSLGPVRVSTDGSQTWSPVSDFGNYCKYLSFLDADIGWVASPDHLGMTTDGGQSWQAVPLPAGVGEILAISLRTPTDGYLLDTNGKLHITSDAGENWLTHDLISGDYAISNHDTASAGLRFVDAQHGLVVVHVSGKSQSKVIAFHTTDSGITWQQEEVIETSLFVSLYLSPDGQYLTIADKMEPEIMLLRYEGEFE